MHVGLFQSFGIFLRLTHLCVSSLGCCSPCWTMLSCFSPAVIVLSKFRLTLICLLHIKHYYNKYNLFIVCNCWVKMRHVLLRSTFLWQNWLCCYNTEFLFISLVICSLQFVCSDVFLFPTRPVPGIFLKAVGWRRIRPLLVTLSSLQQQKRCLNKFAEGVGF